MALSPESSTLAEALLDTGCVKRGQFTLSSGAVSDIYVDLRDLRSLPEVKRLAVDAYLDVVNQIGGVDPFQHVVDIPDGVSPVVASVADRLMISQLTVIKQPKEHGIPKMVLGRFQEGDHAVMLDDVSTTGGSFLRALPHLRVAKLAIRHAVVLVDRQSGGTEALANNSVKLHAALTLDDLRTK